MEHTKLPWKCVGDGYSISTTDRKALYIAQTHPFDLTGKANAQYIVRAGNAFPAMEKALRDVQIELRLLRARAINDDRLDAVREIDKRVSQVKAALAAGGE